MNHQHTLSLAQQIIRAVKANDNQQLRLLQAKAVDYYKQELEAHFQHEEDVVFHLFTEEHRQHQALIDGYLQEHQTLRQQIAEFGKEQSVGTLPIRMEAFALLLKSHTRKEERVLFPLIEESLTEKQLQQMITVNQ